VNQAVEAGISVDDNRWNRVADLFDRLLEGADLEEVLATDPDPEIRTAALNLWQHHIRAEREDYLGAPMEFEIAPAFQPGQVLLNRFRVNRLLGRGGMGEVYLARDERVDDDVALKTIARLLTASPSMRRRFIAEVQSARRVTHPNVCRIHELFEDGETVFFSMEYVEGVPLSQILGSGSVVQHPRFLVRQMAEGLHAAHRIGVVHGDFKPSNVMIVAANEPSDKGHQRAVILDFGLARALGRAADQGESGLSVHAGTLDYMAPELRAGGPPSVSSDIFALGKVARELLPTEHLWEECTHPEPERRPISLEKIVEHLDSQRSRRYWMVIAAIVATGAARYAIWPPSRNAAILPAGARVLINGFRSVGAQLSSARLTRSLFLTALLQSPRIHAIADEDLLGMLQRLQPRENLPLSGRILIDILQKLRAAFWIEGDLHQAGARYSLDLRLMTASGQNIVAASAFHDMPSVLGLARAAALWLRETAGESGQSLALNPADVGSYTSQIPEALQKYYDALEQYAVGQMDQAIPLLEEALRLDPNFAQAHMMLALTYNAAWRYSDGFREIDIAMRLAHQLPERERAVVQMYYHRISEDPLNAVEAARKNLAYRPDEPRSYSSLGKALSEAGSSAEALTAFRKAAILAPDDWIEIELLEEGEVEAGEYSAALETFQMALSKNVPNTWIYNGAGSAYMGLERYEDAIRSFAAEPPDSENATDIQSAKIMQGHLEPAIAAMEQQLAGSHTPIETHAANEFLCGLYFVTDRLESARSHARAMADLPAFPPMASRLDCTASWARRVGDEDTLQRVRATAEEIARRWSNAHTQAVETHVNALALWHRNALEDAERRLLQSAGMAFSVWTLFDLAEFFTRRAQCELAEEYWKQFEARRGTVLVKGWFPGILVLGWLYRAVAAQVRNERRTAFAYSRKVLDHWFASNPRLAVVQTARNINLM
jgi:serine/threonine protein kinase/Flp pilus assembly protein TadD